MARRLYCYVSRSDENRVDDEEWEQIRRLQHWYSSEFIWTAGKPSLKMYVIFPNDEHPLAESGGLNQYITEQWLRMKSDGAVENEIIRRLYEAKVILLKEGGYYDGCLLSGSVRVADNEWNAYLFCEFIIKASRLARRATFEVRDEGEFIRWRPVFIRDGEISVTARSQRQEDLVTGIIKRRELFSPVFDRRYDRHPYFRSRIAGFSSLEELQKEYILKQWNSYGFESSREYADSSGDFYDLHHKVSGFKVVRIDG